MSIFNLPDAGEGLTEAMIVTWHVKPGDVVKVNDVLLEIETAKSIVELPSPFAGEIQAILVNEGETVAVGTPLIEIHDSQTSSPPSTVESTDSQDSNPREPVLVGYGPKTSSAKRGRERKVTAGAETVGSRVLAKPPVRKLAKDLGVDIQTVVSSSGVVTRSDVQAAAQHNPGASASSPSRAHHAGERIEVTSVRKATAQSVTESAFTAPHVSIWVETDVTATIELLGQLRSRNPEVPISWLTIVGRLVTMALKSHPYLNSSWKDDHIVLHEHVDLGFAAATERGLLVVHTKNAEQQSFEEFAREIHRLKNQARSGKATPAELVGGTFTITNIGIFGVDGGTPILVPSQSGILSMGRIVKKPWVVDGDIQVRDVMVLALSFDHRVVDGEQGSLFLADLAATLNNPALAIAV